MKSYRGLFNLYLGVTIFELEELGCKPTELRHLIGRMGELYCAMHVDGELAKTVNQHGFDVQAPDGRKISVKTTAQTKNFVTINTNTAGLVDDLMLLQFENEEMKILYYGPISVAIENSRKGTGPSVELDLNKAKKIGKT